MKELYATVEVKLLEKRERTDYYVVKGNLYGIEIVKTQNFTNIENFVDKDFKIDNQNIETNENNEKVIKEEIYFHEISNNESIVKSVIDMFIAENSDFEQMKYIIDDCKENQNNNVAV